MTTPGRKPLFSSGWHFDALVCLGLVLAVFIPYQQVAGHRFVEFDDGVYAFQNTLIIRGLNWDSICWAFTNYDSANWHPLTWISHLVDREIFGPYPGGYLLENVAWHALASCLCYAAFRQATGNRLFGFVVALIFAVHPANVENVAWASERKSLLNAVFWFAAIITYLDYIDTRSFRAYGFTALAFLLSLMSKPMSVTLPFTLSLVHALRLVSRPDPLDPGMSLRQLLKVILLPVLPLLLVSAYFSAVTLVAQATAMPPDGYPIQLRIINALLSCERYLGMFFHPTGLAIFYPLYNSDLTLRVAVPAALLVSALTAVVVLLVRREPRLLIGWCWFLGTLVPVIGLVQVGSQSHADRYLYIPMLGLAFVFPVLFDALRPLGVVFRRAVATVSVIVLGISMVLATQIQVSYWRDGIVLFRHALAVSGDCVTSVFNLAVAYGRQGRFDEMIGFANAKIAVAEVPMNKGKLEALKGIAYYNLQKYKLAIASAEKALEWGDTRGSAYWTLAISHFELGDYGKSAEFLAKARGVQGRVREVNLIEMQRDGDMTRLEGLLKAKSPGDGEQRTPPAGSPKASDPRN